MSLLAKISKYELLEKKSKSILAELEKINDVLMDLDYDIIDESKGLLEKIEKSIVKKNKLVKEKTLLHINGRVCIYEDITASIVFPSNSNSLKKAKIKIIIGYSFKKKNPWSDYKDEWIELVSLKDHKEISYKSIVKKLSGLSAYC